jgi:hypothetical protein
VNILRLSAAISLLAIVAGCNSSSPSDALGVGQPSATAAAAPVSPVVQANCPSLTILDSTASHRVYAGNAKDDAEKLVYQASFGDSTRSCSMNMDTLTVNVLVQGRLVPGPSAKPGRVNLPIRVTVRDGDKDIFSELTQFPVDLPASGGAQFLFNNDHVAIPNAAGGASRGVNVFVAFENSAPRKK